MSEDIRPGEIAIELPASHDAGLHFIGRIATPWPSRRDCPKNAGERADALATVTLEPRYWPALQALDGFSHVYLLYWMDEARRDLVQQWPAHASAPRGTFSLRSPVRPNPIALSVSEIVELRLATGQIVVRRIDCRDGTPLLDIKPYFASVDAFPGARRP